MIEQSVKNIVAFINQFERVSIAVSGGIDSMLLAYIAHRFSKADVKVVHAYSPAVPKEAFDRVKSHAEQHQWDLAIIDAKEFDDTNYINNPVNRCYFCKSNLYTRVAKVADNVVFSGTNLDDLGDFRPGLEAAKEQHVKHPYVEAGIGKTTIYKIAEFYGLTQLHRLPAQPCLASRVETGIKIDAHDLGFINRIEEKTRNISPNLKSIRCRITHQGTFLEIEQIPENTLVQQLSKTLTIMCAKEGRIFSGIRPYQKGSAFLNGVVHG